MRRRIQWLKYIPQTFRHALIRRALSISPVADPTFRVQIATTQEDLEKAYGLLHDSYASIGLMKPHPSGMRCTLYSALPYTTVIVAKIGDQVVGTVSLIKDSEVGFPSDKDYLLENNSYRQQGFQMVEVSALAIHENYRKRRHVISLHLMKYLYFYAMQYMGCDMFCATVHPRAKDFYVALFGFRQNGKTVSYKFVNGALAIHITLDLRPVEYIMASLYQNAPRERDLNYFIYQQTSNFLFPERKSSHSLDPVMTPDLLKYFFLNRTSLFKELSKHELTLVQNAYALHFDLDYLPKGDEEDSKPNRPFRYLTHLQAALVSANSLQIGTVLDLSVGGAFFACKELLRTDQKYELLFNMNGELFRLQCLCCWRNEGGNLRYPAGFGIKFLVADLRLEAALKAIHIGAKNTDTAPESEPRGQAA